MATIPFPVFFTWTLVPDRSAEVPSRRTFPDIIEVSPDVFVFVESRGTDGFAGAVVSCWARAVVRIEVRSKEHTITCLAGAEVKIIIDY